VKDGDQLDRSWEIKCYRG